MEYYFEAMRFLEKRLQLLQVIRLIGGLWTCVRGCVYGGLFPDNVFRFSNTNIPTINHKEDTFARFLVFAKKALHHEGVHR